PERLCGGKGNSASEEDRAARQIRVDRADPRNHRYLCKDDRKEARRISIPKPAQSSWIHYYEAVRATGIGMDHQYWARRKSLRHAFIATDQGKPDLPSHREPACGPTFTGPSQNREYCALSWFRGRRRACHSRTGRCVNYQGRAASLCPSIVL